MTMNFEGLRCLSWRDAPNGRSLLGFVDLWLHGMIFHDVALHGRADGLWLSFPVRSRGRDGKPKRLVHFENQELYDAFQRAAIAAVMEVPGVELAIQSMEKRIA